MASPHNPVLAEWLKLSSWPMSRSTRLSTLFLCKLALYTGYTRVYKSTFRVTGARVKRVISMAKYALNIAFIINADRFRARIGMGRRVSIEANTVSRPGFIVVIDILRWICIKFDRGKRWGDISRERSRHVTRRYRGWNILKIRRSLKISFFLFFFSTKHFRAEIRKWLTWK